MISKLPKKDLTRIRENRTSAAKAAGSYDVTCTISGVDVSFSALIAHLANVLSDEVAKEAEKLVERRINRRLNEFEAAVTAAKEKLLVIVSQDALDE